MTLLLDIGNTHTHAGLADGESIRRHKDMPTQAWSSTAASKWLGRFVGRGRIEHVALCSVVPRATGLARRVLRREWGIVPWVLTHRNLPGLGISYPRPHRIGPDRLCNALAACHTVGAPAIVVNFGTATTFDVVDQDGQFIGGAIAPGLAVMTEYLHDKTARLPLVRLRECPRAIGKSTEEAILIGAVHGYAALVRGVLQAMRKELGRPTVPVIATGGCARFVAHRVPEITHLEPLLTLEGLRRARTLA